MTNPTPTSADARSKAYDKIDRHLRGVLDDALYAEYSAALECIWASEVEAAQAQPASVVGKIVELDYVHDVVGVKVAAGVAESLSICAQVALSAHGAASTSTTSADARNKDTK